MAADGHPAPQLDPELMFDVEMLPAGNGDALWIEYGSPGAISRVLIDCGRPDTVDRLLPRMRGPNAPHFELFVMTHIDLDHIGGAIPLLEDETMTSTFRDVWFNGWKQVNRYLAVGEGEDFSKLIVKRGLNWNNDFSNQQFVYSRPVEIPRSGPLPCVTLPGGMTLTLLSPVIADLRRLARVWRQERIKLRRKGLLRRTRPEQPSDPAELDIKKLAETKPGSITAANRSSIAFLAEFGGRSILLTGDAHVGVLAQSITKLQRQRGHESKRLVVDALKMSHHGSKNNVSKALLDTIDCPWYLVSSNGDGHYHPDREAIARVLHWGGDEPTLFFNYRTKFNDYWEHAELQGLHGFSTVYPSGESLKVSLMASNRLRVGTSAARSD